MRAFGVNVVALFAAVLFAACGPPIARNVPQPNTAAAAGIAAGAAAAITLADPQGAAARQEEKKPTDEKKPQKSQGSVPADVLDRLDEKQHREKAQQPEPEPPAPEPGAQP